MPPLDDFHPTPSFEHTNADMHSRCDFSVAIVGGGMCGLALAIVLSRSGIDVDLFESHSDFGEIGASVTFGANALRAFSLMGLMETICTYTGQQPKPAEMTFTLSTKDGEEEELNHWEGGLEDLVLHRVAFLNALVPLLPSKHVHFRKCCTDVSYSHKSGLYQVHFNDGTYHRAHLVIGADGIKSVVRKVVVQGVGQFCPERENIDSAGGGESGDDDHASTTTPPLEEFTSGSRLGEDKNLMFTGISLYRALIPYEVLEKAELRSNVQRMKTILGSRGNIFTVPVQAGRLINIAAYASMEVVPAGTYLPPLPPPWVVKEVPNDEMTKNFREWSEDISIILRNMGNSSYWALHSIGPTLDSFVRGGVALIGDAAHASTPFLGAGVGQGIEDVYLLWKLLSHPKCRLKNLGAILTIYDTIRRPRANEVVLKSATVPSMFAAVGEPDASQARRPEKIEEWRTLFNDIKKHDVETDFERAVKWLEAEGHF